jgi:elongation factor 2
MDAQLCDDMIDRGSTQVSRAMSRAILGSCLTAKPVLLEPICKIEVTAPTRLFGMCAKIITRRHGKIDFTENRGNLTMIRGHIPTTETFGLSSEMRSTTSGRAIWQSIFDHWKEIQGDAAANVIRQLREKRGLRAEVPEPQKFIDEI